MCFLAPGHRRRWRLDSPADLRAVDARPRCGRLRPEYAQDSGNEWHRLNYVGIPGFYLTTFTGLGNAQGANPFEFRDNQFTGDVNLSWLHGHHAVKFGYTYYHFDLNHFQPTSGGQPNTPRGGFTFQGGMTCGLMTTQHPPHCSIDGYNSLADFQLGLPNNGSGQAIGDPSQVYNPNALRWTEHGTLCTGHVDSDSQADAHLWHPL